MCVGNLASEPPSKRSKTHRHSYRYDPTTRAQIGEYTYNNGPAAAVRHFSMLLGYRIPESTTRKFRDAYVTELKKQRNSDSSDPLHVQTLPTKPRGRTLMLGDLDDIVKEYIKQLRTAGGAVSTAVIMAAARGIILSKNRALLVP